MASRIQNYERPHRGYRNMGGGPIETIEQGKKIREKVQASTPKVTLKEAA